MKRIAVAILLALAGFSRAEAQTPPGPPPTFPSAPNPAPGPAPAAVQETYCITAPPAQVTRIDDGISRSNAMTCTRYGLVNTCNQGQVCAAAGCAGGTNCSPAQARTCNVRIWDNTSQPGREEFVNEMTKNGFNNLERGIVAFDNNTYCSRFKASTREQKDQSCLAVNFVQGCEVCP